MSGRFGRTEASQKWARTGQTALVGRAGEGHLLTFKLGLMTYRCLHGQEPRYLADHVTPAAIEVASRHRLRSANRHRLIVPRCRLNTYCRRAFPVAGPTVWNSLPDELRDPACDVDSFKQFFKTILFSSY